MKNLYLIYCLIKANKTSTHSTTLTEVGGIAGRYENNMNYCGVMNTSIIAPKYTNVGGVVGRFAVNLTSNISVGNCYYLANYDTNKELRKPETLPTAPKHVDSLRHSDNSGTAF